jgi:polar amino acid transport system substrate-binding protein
MRHVVCILFCIVLTLAGRPAVSVEAPVTITLRADAWCPFNCEPGSERPGYMVEVAREIFAKHSIAIDYQLLSWARVLDDVKQGRSDGAIGASLEPGRGFMFGPNPLGEGGMTLAVRRGYGFRYDGPESLKGHRIGVVRDYSYDGGPLDAYIAANSRDLSRVVTIGAEDVGDKLIRLLLSNRVDIILESGPVLAYQANRINMADRIEQAGRLPPDYISIGFTPAKPDGERWARILSDGVAEMRASGRLAEILALYGLTDFAPPPLPTRKPGRP